MADGGEVHRDVVVHVLERHRVGVEISCINGSAEATLARNGVVVVYVLPDMVGRRMLHTLKRKFDIPIHHFYRPEMIGDISEHVN